MSKNFKKIGGNKVSGQLSAKAFFKTENNKNGYVVPEEFVVFYENLRDTDYQGLEAGIDAMQNNLSLNNGHIDRYDEKFGTHYVFAEVKYQKGSTGIKIPIVGELKRFIRDYQFGKFTINFTLEDLYSEACSFEEVELKELGIIGA